MKIPKLLFLCMVSIPFFRVVCNFSKKKLQPVTSSLAQCPGQLCTLDIANDQEAWALSFLKTSDQRSLMHYTNNHWSECRIPCLDPHLIASTQDNSLYIVGRDKNYTYSLWRFFEQQWQCLGTFESEYGYPVMLAASTAHEAIVSLCPCKGSNQSKCNAYYWNNIFLLKRNYLATTQMCVSDTNELMLCCNEKEASDNLVTLRSLCSPKIIKIPKQCVGVVFKDNEFSYALVNNYDSAPHLFFKDSHAATWKRVENKPHSAVIKGSKNKTLYVLDSNNHLFRIGS